ncbi:metallophosphoesterase [Formosa sediminum]|uniref:Metallophosphoesterase n=1 Tax=Formosa sediminum TaxID=2594004 RepID=A0A516GQX4_9FLAO|nr:metallophosphoesterase [Formosa sediminum]QDO93893.1 metallophosphoesterase [Formosa sediminum]
MKTYSLSVIILLCFTILVVDAVSFYWLQAIIKHVPSQELRIAINVVFIGMSFSLILAIIILKLRLDHIDVKKKQRLISSLYGITVAAFVPKICFVLFVSLSSVTNSILSNTESVYIVPVLGIIAWAFPLSAILYAIFKAVYHFKIYTISVQHDDLPNAFDGLRIVHISDLHLGSLNYRYKVLDKAIHIINTLKPDILCFTGDLINNYAWELKGWEASFLKLSPEIKKYAVLGNHDYGDYSKWPTKLEKQDNLQQLKAFYETIQFKLLMNTNEVIEIDNAKLYMVGVENWGMPPFKQYGDLKQSLTGIETKAFKILMSHDPTHWSEEVIKNTNIALTLSGHTHGMQAGFQTKNKAWSPIQYKYKHWAGLYKENNQYLYVTRGLGWLGFPGRLGMRPEITQLTLHN